MNLDELRAGFPALERVTYLNTATAAPGARPVLEAMRRVEDEWVAGEFSWQAWEEEAEATRGLFADLVGGRPEHVALVSTVSEAAATVAASLPQGRVVVGAREFQSNLFPWLALRERGFDVVEVQPTDDGVVRTDALIEAIDDRTVLAAVSEVQSANGFRVHVERIAERCRETGARLFVDAIQSLGALRFVPGADFVAAHGYKWLCGPRGAGWLWITPQRLTELRPLAPSWKTVPEPYEDYYGGPMVLPDHARRVDTSLAWLTWPGALAALRMLAEVDPVAVEERSLGLARAFREEAEGRGFRVVPEDAPSQVVALAVEDPESLRTRLREHRVIAAVRGGSLRLGFHGYNDETDLEAALEALGKG